jgi:hypothetical protein
MTGQLGRLEKLEQGGLSRTKQFGRLKKLGQGLTRVEPNLEGWKRWGKEPPVEPSSFERLRGQGQGLALVEPRLPNGSIETLNR